MTSQTSNETETAESVLPQTQTSINAESAQRKNPCDVSLKPKLAMDGVEVADVKWHNNECPSRERENPATAKT